MKQTLEALEGLFCSTWDARATVAGMAMNGYSTLNTPPGCELSVP
jgi:hypothetical protein